MLHDINSFAIICVCVCVYIYIYVKFMVCVCVPTPFSVNWEVVMVGGKCEQKVCSFQEQSAGKKLFILLLRSFPFTLL